MNLSPQQSAVIKWVKTGKGSAFVEAVAGAGKTSTLIQACAETTGSVAFAAFNKKIADEIAAKVAKLNLGNRIRVGTFHSFGFNAWRRVHPKVQLDERKKAERTLEHLELNERTKPIAPFILKLVSLAKQRAIGLYGAVDDESLWYAIIEHFDLAFEIEDESLISSGVVLAIEALKYQTSIGGELIDFDDMIYLPVVSGCRMWENDWFFGDEFQDTNPARRAMARKMLRPGGHACFVGDRCQSVFGFTGADADAVDQVIKEFNCITLPLTITYRCPKAVVALAQEVVSHIQAADSAPEGAVRTIEEKDLLAQNLTVTDAILCRKTKPLVDTAYQLIRNSIACHVEGRDIGLGLLKLVNKFAARDLETLRDKLEAYADRECNKLVAKGKETQAEALRDRVETVLVMADGAKDVGDLRQRITDLFYDDGDKNNRKPSVTLSTIHKAKGREWPRVFILGRNVWMPSPWARMEWQQYQESCLIYVAYTRAQQELVLVNVTRCA